MRRVLWVLSVALFCSSPAAQSECLDEVNPPLTFGATNVGSDFGFELGQSFIPEVFNLSSVEIFFGDNTPIDQTTPVKLSIWRSNSLNFTTGTLVGAVTQQVPEGPGVDTDPSSPANQSSAIFVFNPPLAVESGKVYVIQVEEDQFPSNTDLSWRAGQQYPKGQAIKDGGNGPWSDWAFQTFATQCTPLPAEETTWGRVKSRYGD